jgi:pilus assembly protein CpaF
LRKPAQKAAAAPAPKDKERKRKERLAEIKLDLHRALLDNLNLAAIDSASEADLRAEISSIAAEVLEEKSIVLNREDRSTLTQELYDEVKGLGRLGGLDRGRVGFLVA